MKSSDSQVFSYQAPWIIYSMGFSSNPLHKFRLGLGSFNEGEDNMVEIV